MPNRKRSNKPTELAAQRIRTHQNKVKFYQRLISGKSAVKLPTPAQIKIWQAKLDYSKAKL